eukprot:Sdes_comp13328_c0_seq1m3140
MHFTTAIPPWMFNSTTSSPVKLAGFSKRTTSPSSIFSPLRGSNSRRNATVLAAGKTLFLRKNKLVSFHSSPKILFKAFVEQGPEIRITATPALPAPEESAKIVDLETNAVEGVLL